MNDWSVCMEVYKGDLPPPPARARGGKRHKSRVLSGGSLHPVSLRESPQYRTDGRVSTAVRERMSRQYSTDGRVCTAVRERMSPQSFVLRRPSMCQRLQCAGDPARSSLAPLRLAFTAGPAVGTANLQSTSIRFRADVDDRNLMQYRRRWPYVRECDVHERRPAGAAGTISEPERKAALAVVSAKKAAQEAETARQVAQAVASAANAAQEATLARKAAEAARDALLEKQMTGSFVRGQWFSPDVSMMLAQARQLTRPRPQ